MTTRGQARRYPPAPTPTPVQTYSPAVHDPRTRPARPIGERRRKGGRRALFVVVLVAVAALAGIGALRPAAFGLGGPQMTPLQGRIVAVANGQIGYRTDPSNTYCNKFSAYWQSGTDVCGNDNLAEEWCADFAAWVWQKAGAQVRYQYVNGDINSSSASFYEWGVAHGTWHPVGSSYTARPGDVAVYGLDTATLVAQHVAVVTGYSSGAKGPDVVNGDGDQTSFSAIESGANQYQVSTHEGSAAISGYVSPSPSPAPGAG